METEKTFHENGKDDDVIIKQRAMLPITIKIYIYYIVMHVCIDCTVFVETFLRNLKILK